MTNDLMERRLSAALDKTAPDDVAGVLSRCTERKGTVVPMKKKNQRMKKWMQAMAACLAVLLLGGGVLVQQAHAVTSVVSLDVNPSIELRVNSREKVVSCQALNDEAAVVLADMDGGRDLKGVKADVAGWQSVVSGKRGDLGGRRLLQKQTSHMIQHVRHRFS